MDTNEITYHVGQTVFRAFVAHNPDYIQPKPCVLVAPDWSGRGKAACQHAMQWAELGYVGVAIDMYGDAAEGSTKEERQALLASVMCDRSQVTARMRAALDAVNALPFVNPAKIMAIGYCFGGLCVLDLARSGADVAGVVSMHGLLFPPETSSSETIRSKILVLHGYDDPLVPPKHVFDFATEMTHKKANWELDMYGHTKHSFSNPEASDDEMGLRYNAQADNRSWHRAQAFFQELLRP